MRDESIRRPLFDDESIQKPLFDEEQDSDLSSEDHIEVDTSAESTEDHNFDPEPLEDAQKDAAREEAARLAPEPLFSSLLKRAIRTLSPDDQVLLDYATYVVPALSGKLAGKAAKGGDFVVDRRAKGVSEDELRRYGDDQSMRAHIVNGLLPVVHVAKLLTSWKCNQFTRTFNDTTYRLFCAGYTLHDWLKLPEVNRRLEDAGLSHSSVNVAVHLPMVEQIITEWCRELGLDRFLAPVGDLDTLLHDLIMIASNTQVKWGTMRVLSALSNLDPQRQAQTRLATDLSTLADYLAYLGRTPVAAAQHEAIRTKLQELSNGEAYLTYHHLADVRGVLTNIINEAALQAYHRPGVREPILYAPTGVVYLERAEERATPTGVVYVKRSDTPSVSDVVGATIDKIRARCRDALSTNLIGFGRDGKGLKYAPYYDLFFTPRQLTEVTVKAADVRTTGKKASAETRYTKMRTSGMIGTDEGGDFSTERTVDMIAEGLAKLQQIANNHAPQFDAQRWLLRTLELEDISDEVAQIPQRAKTGGVPYDWYYASAILHQRRPGLSDIEWSGVLRSTASELAERLPDEIVGAGWNDLGAYITANLRFERTPVEQHDLRAQLTQELRAYTGAHKIRNSTAVCSLCSSAYAVSEQRESGVLFAPMVYSNKQPLHGNKGMRSICAICEMEMMLRQVTMNKTAAVGKRFEARRTRYLFLYPTYFFTPETLAMLHEVSGQLKRASFTSLRQVLVRQRDGQTPELNLDDQTFQHLEDFLLDENIVRNPSEDRLFRAHYSEDTPASFAFVGIPPASRDATEAEAWIQPAFLSLVLPLLLDVKVVASESMMPIFNEATELPETVVFDGPHAFVTYLVGENRINLDRIGPALRRLTSAYLIHLDGNARVGAGGYDYRWRDMPALARDLDTSPLYAFAYLKKWQRRADLDSFGVDKAHVYGEFFRYICNTTKGETDMSHARELVTRYRKFYRHARGKLNSNTILRPIAIVSREILIADPRLFDSDDALVEAARGRMENFIEGVDKRSGGEGSIPRFIPAPERQQALEDFCSYFVHNVYRGALAGDRAAMQGKQLNLLRNACEAVYMELQRKEWAEHNERPESKQVVDDLNVAAAPEEITDVETENT